MADATLESIAKDLRKVLLEFDSLRREVRDIPPTVKSMEAKIEALSKEISNMKGGRP